jgi:hypothetical protein
VDVKYCSEHSIETLMSLIYAAQLCRKLTCVVAQQLSGCSASQYAASPCIIQAVSGMMYVFGWLFVQEASAN